MKLLFYIFLLFASTFVLSCSSSKKTNSDFRIEFVEENTISPIVKSYKFQYLFNSNTYMSITAFVYSEENEYLILINTNNKNSNDNYRYDTTKKTNNFKASNRVKSETVKNFDEAIKLAIKTYVADNI